MSEHDHIEERRMNHGVVRWIYDARGRPRYTHYDCERRVKAARTAFGRWFARAVKTRTTWDDAEMNEAEIRELRWMLGDMQTYIESGQRYLDEIEGRDRRAERIKALREVAGRTPAEAAAYLAKADDLEAEAV